MLSQSLANHGTWVGRELKSFVQIAPLLCQLASDGGEACSDILDLFIIIASLHKILYHFPPHMSINAVADMVDGIVIDYLTFCHNIFIGTHLKVFNTYKNHVIRHIPNHIIAYGPLAKVSTETHEKLNGPIRRTRHEVCYNMYYLLNYFNNSFE